MGFNLLKNRVYWGYNTLTNLLLTSWDTQVHRRHKAMDLLSLTVSLQEFTTSLCNYSRHADALASKGVGHILWGFPPQLHMHDESKPPKNTSISVRLHPQMCLEETKLHSPQTLNVHPDKTGPPFHGSQSASNILKQNLNLQVTFIHTSYEPRKNPLTFHEILGV